MKIPRKTRSFRAGRFFASLVTEDLHAKRMAFQVGMTELYSEHSSACRTFVQVLRGRLCFRGVSWLLLCTSKEVTRCPKDSGSFALASKEVTRSAAGRAEALLLETNRANNSQAEALRLWREQGTAY